MMAARRISSAQDFPNLVVYERDTETGPVYTIAFNNLEYPLGLQKLSLHLIVGIGFLLMTAGLFFGAFYAMERGISGWYGAGFFFVVGGLLFRYGLKPKLVKRAIELDIGRQTLRVLKRGQTEIERAFTGLEPLTVKEHPNAEFGRSRRQQVGRKNLYVEEMQHCLIGYFGARGADEVILVSRAEWPCRYSLREVREAILWALEQAVRRMAESGGAPSAASPHEGGGTIKPPLD